MLTTSVQGDLCTHGAILLTGSTTRMVNGQPVARLGDLVECPIHGRNAIAIVMAGMPETDGNLTCHANAVATCGAVVLPSIFNSPAPAGVPSSSELALMENDDQFESSASGNWGGSTPEADAARARSLMASASANGDAEPTTADGAPVTEAVSPKCRDIPENAGDAFQLSKYFRLGDLSSRALCARSPSASSGPVEPNKGLARAEIICNLRHLAVNALDPIAAHYGRSAMQITSGFRDADNNSDHNIGSAVDIQFLINGRKANGRELDAIEKYIILTLKIPFTQIIHENNSWLHIACRKTGVNSAKRICWWAGGAYNNGYRY